MLVTRSPHRPQMNSQALTVQPPAMVWLPLLIWWHLASAKSTKPSGKTHQGLEREAGKAAREGLAVQGALRECRDSKHPTKLNKVVHTHSTSCSWVLSATGDSGELPCPDSATALLTAKALVLPSTSVL